MQYLYTFLRTLEQTIYLDFPVNKKPPVKQSKFSKAFSEQVEK